MSITRRTVVQTGAALGGTVLTGCATATEVATLDDPLFTQPYIDTDEWRDEPHRHRYVHGGFTGTDLRFSMYFPPAERYQGRFFHPVMHIAGNEHGFAGRLAGIDGDTMGFAFSSGGYMVESNMGSLTMAGPEDITNWRASAATAQYSRQLAQEMYGGARPYGYVYGGSGGAFKSTACVEHTRGVWDGAVPFIHGSPVSMPNVFTVQAHAMRILDGKWAQIVDALDPGGSGDMYAGLNAEERAALEEVTRMGMPPRAWFAHERISIGYTGVLAAIIYYLLQGDPTYVNDFWTQPGYLGSDPALRAARVQERTTLSGVVTTAQMQEMGLPVSISAGTRRDAPAAIRVANLPQKRLTGSYITVRSGASVGQPMMVIGVTHDLILIGFDDRQIPALAQMQAGDELEIDNSVYLAAQTFHRHQMPPEEFYVWNQFKNADGTAKYVQRPLLPNYRTTEVRDNTQSGKFDCKLIVMECLMDEAAYPWQGDWYHNKVRDHLGDKIDDQYRIWMVDHAMHVSPNSYLEIGEGGAVSSGHSPVETRIISYSGILQQALRDVAAWAERGVAPAATTNYSVNDGQIVVPDSAAQRLGVQPTVDLKVNGGVRADVRRGQAVTLTGVIDAPPNAGNVVAAEWDFDGSGAFAEKAQVTAAQSVSVTTTHTYTEPGTYFAVLRGIVQRPEAVGTPYAQVKNLGRVRVVVS
jgi:hypothetical protein